MSAAKRKLPLLQNGDGFTAKLVLQSTNRKTGKMPVSMSDPATCPATCPFVGAGCYAESTSYIAHHWSQVSARGRSWLGFCAQVSVLPDRQIWRHAEAGDLPGVGCDLDIASLGMLVRANEGKRGFTFTHKPLSTDAERVAVRAANDSGFTVNLSANSLSDADRLVGLRVGPVAVVLPHDAPCKVRTPQGHPVVVCPNQTDGLTCLECKLCAKPQRKAIVGFRAHGPGKRAVSELSECRVANACPEGEPR